MPTMVVNPTKCVVCGKNFANVGNLNRHLSTHNNFESKTKRCSLCEYSTNRSDALKRHYTGYHKLTAVGITPLLPPEYTSSGGTLQPPLHTMPSTLKGNGAFYEPQDEVSLLHLPQPENGSAQATTSTLLESEATDQDPCTFLRDQISDDDRIQNLIEENVNFIKTKKHRPGKRLQHRYNYELSECAADTIANFVKEIASEQQHPFLLNLAFGFVLENVMTNQLVFYYASTNNRLLDRPVLIRNQSDVKNFISRFETEDLLAYCRNQRPNTKYVVRLLTNALFYVNRLPSYNVGCGDDLPNYLRNRTCIISFITDQHGMPYTDRLCFFRCYVYHVYKNRFASKNVLLYYAGIYCGAKQKAIQTFDGVPLTDLKILEQLFHICVDVYHQTEVYWGRKNVETRRVRASDESFADRMNLALYKGHFSYIQDLKTFAHTWQCSYCNKMFRRPQNLSRHEASCSAGMIRKFPGGGCGFRRTIFEELYEEGIEVPWDDKFYPFVLALDCEAMSTPVPEATGVDSKKHKILGEQVLASISISTNVPEFRESQCFVSNGNPDELMERTMRYMLDVAQTAENILKQKYEYVTEALIRLVEAERSGNGISGDRTGDMEQLEQSQGNSESRCERLYRQFTEWLGGLTCLTFNGKLYDLPLLRRHLFPYCLNNGIKVDHIIKKGNSYLSVQVGPLIFRDVSCYLNAGCSYAGWLAASGIKETKGYFPFDCFQSIDFLDNDRLPDHADFFSTLKQKNITAQQYEYVQDVWKENNFTSIRQLLCWYNNRDTSYFVKAAEKMMEVWKELKFDCFRGGDISMPGLALRYLITTMQPHTILPLFTTQTADLYDDIRENLVGGLAITMHRYHESGVTLLPNGKPCECIRSYDANQLYGFALGQHQPTSLFRVWRCITDVSVSLEWNVNEWEEDSLDFEAKKQQWLDKVTCNMSNELRRRDAFPFARSEAEWLDWMSFSQRIRIDHKFNGRPKTIHLPNGRRYRVDGYNAEARTVFSFLGCYWHGHGCHLDREKNQTKQRHRRAKTSECNDELIKNDYFIEAIWECAWRDKKRTNVEIQRFIEENLNLGIKQARCRVSDLLEMIENGIAFGILQCDVEIPPWNKKLLKYFDEYPPICKHVNLSRRDLSPHMLKYAEANGYMKAPVKCLVNSFWARKMMFATPLVCWFMSHGLVVTRVYKFIEAKPKQCFAHLRNMVADKRREADCDPALKPVGETWKTILNSCYGKTMARKELYKDTVLVADDAAEMLMNDARFSKMEEVGEDAYEICMEKKSVRLDVPVYISLCILNGAKKRMNEFVYDGLKRYLREGSFQLCASDTDSIWAAYESANLSDLIKPEMRDEFERYGKAAFFATDSYTNRTPGLFKEEKTATGFISLGSKTYLAWSDDGTAPKVSSKGLSHTTNHFTKQDFMNVLTTKKKGIGVNYGFQIVGDRVMTYKQEREGLPYLYCKRYVEEDGITTKALLV